MSRMPYRGEYKSPLGTPKPAGAKSEKKPRYTRQRAERLSKDATYREVAAIYKSENPYCFFCGEETPALQTDHLCSGVAGRASSLLDFETWINQCPRCHEKKQPIEEKLAAKIRNVILAVERHRGKKLTTEQCEKVLQGIRGLLR